MNAGTKVHNICSARITSWLLIALLASGCAGNGRREAVSVPLLDAFRAAVTAGDAAMLASQYPAAASAYLYAHRIDPANYAVSTKLGDALLAAGDLKAALDNFETALALDANFAPALQGAGVVLVRQRRWTDALSLLRQAVAQDPSLWKAHSALGIAADMLHDHVLAATHHARAIALHPEESELHSNLGYSLCLAGRLDDAAAQLWTAIELDGKSERAWRNLAMVRVKQNDVPGALRALREIEGFHAALNDLGVMAEAAGQYETAQVWFARAVVQYPEYQRARDNLEALAVRRLDESKRQ